MQQIKKLAIPVLSLLVILSLIQASRARNEAALANLYAQAVYFNLVEHNDVKPVDLVH